MPWQPMRNQQIMSSPPIGPNIAILGDGPEINWTVLCLIGRKSEKSQTNEYGSGLIGRKFSEIERQKTDTSTKVNQFVQYAYR